MKVLKTKCTKIVAIKCECLSVSPFVSECLYSGMWLNDKRHGQGVYLCAADGAIYKGQWNDGRKEGTGVQLFKEGHRLEGKWKSGQLQTVTVSQQPYNPN